MISPFVSKCAPTLETLEIVCQEEWIEPAIFTQCKSLKERTLLKIVFYIEMGISVSSTPTLKLLSVLFYCLILIFENIFLILNDLGKLSNLKLKIFFMGTIFKS